MIIKIEDMMKKLVLSVIILCGFTMSLLAQGIQFREGNWKEILEIAKKENKLVFVDNYTSWCGDVLIGRSENCGSRKRVETDVLDKVAAFEGFFNQGGFSSAAHFRNVELDARERGCHGSDEYG